MFHYKLRGCNKKFFHKRTCPRLAQDLVQGAKIMAAKILPGILSEILASCVRSWPPGQDLTQASRVRSWPSCPRILSKNFLLGRVWRST